jgi:hypothetical protein
MREWKIGPMFQASEANIHLASVQEHLQRAFIDLPHASP